MTQCLLAHVPGGSEAQSWGGMYIQVDKGLKEQCRGAEEVMSPKASEKKKWVQVKSLEVEVQASSSRSKSVAGKITSIPVRCHLYDLLQETKYQQMAEVVESSDKESLVKRLVMGRLTRMQRGRGPRE
ncbi:hypothetical protein EDC04DRAFT_2597757 [Pisolithus marmoratus]|nr:hypothetical protein EDC04DRAFT_2597757 [Pisolithus marmoratus]